MGFESILLPQRLPDLGTESARQPSCFVDLNLDQVVSAIIAGRDEYDLAPFFYLPLPDVDAVAYRQEVMRDLEDDDLASSVEEFAEGMRTMRRQQALGQRLHHRLQRQAWLLEAIATYVGAVGALAFALPHEHPRSRGLRGLCAHLEGHVDSDEFHALARDVEHARTTLRQIEYLVRIDGSRVHVDHYRGERDYSAEIEASFAKFRQGDAKDYRKDFRSYEGMSHVEERVLELVARLNPDVFAELQRCCEMHADCVDPVLARFDREVQFYLACRDHARRLGESGFDLCYPQVSDASRQMYAEGTFDIALAGKLLDESAPIVPNSWRLDDPERIFVVSGPNQGGKTTFARMFGQLHHLASLGCKVPGSRAQLMLADHVFTHFERQEDLSDEHGKLEDDLARVHDMLARTTARSIVIMNESFSSTALQDARHLGERVLAQLIELRAPAVYVTFVDELASLDDAIVSMTSSVDAADPTVRTLKITRKAADGRAFAAALAEKHHLTYEGVIRQVMM